MTQAVTDKAGLAIEATSVPEQFEIKDLDAFKGKGGSAAIVSSKATSLKYFVLPGGQLTIGSVKVAMDGAAIPLQQSGAKNEPAKAN